MSVPTSTTRLAPLSKGMLYGQLHAAAQVSGRLGNGVQGYAAYPAMQLFRIPAVMAEYQPGT
jgi:hypothetical protein